MKDILGALTCGVISVFLALLWSDGGFEQVGQLFKERWPLEMRITSHAAVVLGFFLLQRKLYWLEYKRNLKKSR